MANPKQSNRRPTRAQRSQSSQARQPQSQKLQKIGALWTGKSAQGVAYMSGVIDTGEGEVRVVVFKNGFRQEDKHPNFIVYLSAEREEQSGRSEPVEDVQSNDEVPFA